MSIYVEKKIEDDNRQHHEIEILVLDEIFLKHPAKARLANSWPALKIDPNCSGSRCHLFAPSHF